jgi:hypothetical protein
MQTLLTRQQIRQFKSRKAQRQPRPVDVLYDDNIYMLAAETREWRADPKPDAAPYTARDGVGQCCIHRQTIKIDELLYGRGMLGPLVAPEWYCKACAEALDARQMEQMK